VSVLAQPHPDNGRKCGLLNCGQRVFWTGTRWADINGNGSHLAPVPREQPATGPQTPHRACRCAPTPETADAAHTDAETEPPVRRPTGDAVHDLACGPDCRRNGARDTPGPT
jgi:hypothetical protein